MLRLMPFDAALAKNLDVLFSSMAGVRDGDTDAIHDARVATRRARTIMRIGLDGSGHDELATLATALRDAGRTLGRARDLDVALSQLSSIESRVPSAPGLVGALRAELLGGHARQRRRLIKRLETLPLDDLKAFASAVQRGRVRVQPGRTVVQDAIAAQAVRVQEAVVAAAGVYMPNRAHVLRIEMKKLRYRLEPLAAERQVAVAVKQMRRAQEVLGLLHDKQGLVDRVRRVDGKESERRAILAMVEQDCRDLFGRYLEHRERVMQVCRELQTGSRIAAARVTQVAALTMMAVPSVLWMLRRRSSIEPTGGAASISGAAGSILDAAPTADRRDEPAVDVSAVRELAVRR